MPKSEKGLSSDQKLEIREEVERRLKELPADTLRIIENEVDRRLNAKAAHYSSLMKWAGLVILIITGATWSNLLLRIREVTRTGTEVETTRTNILALHSQMTQVVAAASKGVNQIEGRVTELEGMTNIVTAQKLKKEMSTVDQLRDEAEDALLTGLGLAASMNNGPAYDRLRAWSTNKDYRLAKASSDLVREIEDSPTGPFRSDAPYNPVALRPVTNFETFQSELDYRPFDEREAAIKQIGNSTNLNMSHRINLLVNIALHDSTIYGRVIATRTLNGVLGTNLFSATNSVLIAKWWETNKAKFEKRP